MVYLHLKFWEHPVIRWCFRCSFAAPTLEPPFSLHCVMIRSLWVKRWEGHDVPSFQTSNTKHPKKSIQQKQHGFLASSSQSKIPWNKLAACHFCSKLDTLFSCCRSIQGIFFPHPQEIALGSLDWPWATLWEVFVPSILWGPTGPNFVGKIEVPRPTDDFCGSWTPEIWYDTIIKHPQNYHSLKGFSWFNLSKPPFSVSIKIQR